jgi:pimeloyl-ACP methyl ester carboxylesterase
MGYGGNGSTAEPIERVAVRFVSNGTECAAWHYPGTNGACVVMAAGLAVTKEPGTDPFARPFARTGFSVLAFDYRRLGESGGHPRQIVRIREQLADWHAAIAFARRLPEVDVARVAIWGFSVSGGHVFRVAATDQGLGAAIAHSPCADGLHAARNAIRTTPLWAAIRLHLAACRDVVQTAVGREAVLVPLTGPRGSVAALTTDDSQNGPSALNPRGVYAWRQEVAARSAIRVGYYRPARVARKITVPLLVLAYDKDGVTPPAPAVRAAQQAPRGELVRLPGGHYEAFIGGHERALAIQLSFLRRHLIDRSRVDVPEVAARAASPRNGADVDARRLERAG